MTCDTLLKVTMTHRVANATQRHDPAASRGAGIPHLPLALLPAFSLQGVAERVRRALPPYRFAPVHPPELNPNLASQTRNRGFRNISVGGFRSCRAHLRLLEQKPRIRSSEVLLSLLHGMACARPQRFSTPGTTPGNMCSVRAVRGCTSRCRLCGR